MVGSRGGGSQGCVPVYKWWRYRDGGVLGWWGDNGWWESRRGVALGVVGQGVVGSRDKGFF